jgi:dTDP-4-dehydrorhamnose 3,5-epimerase-like enzyme
MVNEVTWIDGGRAFDKRGSVSFVNTFEINDFKRFYVVRNHEARQIRAWHGHKHEMKAVHVLQGEVLVGAVKVDDFLNPSSEAEPFEKVLSSSNPGVLLIPKGYANGFMSLSENAVVQFFSSSTIEQSLNDDYRFDSRLWDIWGRVEH